MLIVFLYFWKNFNDWVKRLLGIETISINEQKIKSETKEKGKDRTYKFVFLKKETKLF